MTDNTRLSTNVGTGDLAVTFDVSFSGDAGAKLQGVGLFGVTGSAESWTINPINGTTANGLYADVRNIQAGANVIGDVGIAARDSGGLSTHSAVAPNSTTGVVVKASGGQVFGVTLFNAGTAARYLKLYNKATTPVAGDTSLLIARLMIPPGGGLEIQRVQGIPFASGISYRICTGIADSDNTAPGSDEVLVNIHYK